MFFMKMLLSFFGQDPKQYVFCRFVICFDRLPEKPPASVSPDIKRIGPGSVNGRLPVLLFYQAVSIFIPQLFKREFFIFFNIHSSTQ